MTPLKVVYDAFFSQVTDDMYMAISEEDTKRDCLSLLYGSLPLFEFPEAPIRIVDDNFSRDLSLEEINILATGMMQIWIQRQVTSIELTRQKFTGQDFKLTSQAAHLSRLMSLLNATKDEHRRLQMLASRRREANGKYESNFDLFVKRLY